MKRSVIFTVLLVMSVISLFAQNQPITVSQERTVSADDILKEAYQTAAKEKKNVFVIFHASWCVWCRKMDSSMNDQSCKDFFNKNYVIRHLTVYESADKKSLENPGAIELLTKYHGLNQGIPFWLVFDKDGKLIADSDITPGVNAGCPAKSEEVDHLIDVLKKSSSITQTQTEAVKKRFLANE
jgi:thioredoxin-related protein